VFPTPWTRVGRRESEGAYRLGSLDRPFSLNPVSNIVTMLTAARDVDLKGAVPNLDGLASVSSE
jgi:hypothetical protein